MAQRESCRRERSGSRDGVIGERGEGPGEGPDGVDAELTIRSYCILYACMEGVVSDLTGLARIRNAALEGFARDGVAATSIRDVAKRAGVSPGLVQHYFQSKAALVEAVNAHVLAIADGCVQRSPRERLAARGSAGARRSRHRVRGGDTPRRCCTSRAQPPTASRPRSRCSTRCLRSRASNGAALTSAGCCAPMSTWSGPRCTRPSTCSGRFCSKTRSIATCPSPSSRPNSSALERRQQRAVQGRHLPDRDPARRCVSAGG